MTDQTKMREFETKLCDYIKSQPLGSKINETSSENTKYRVILSEIMEILEPMLFTGVLIKPFFSKEIRLDGIWSHEENTNGFYLEHEAEMNITVKKDNLSDPITRKPTCHLWMKHDDPPGDVSSDFEFLITGAFEISYYVKGQMQWSYNSLIVC